MTCTSCAMTPHTVAPMVGGGKKKAGNTLCKCKVKGDCKKKEKLRKVVDKNKKR